MRTRLIAAVLFVGVFGVAPFAAAQAAKGGVPSRGMTMFRQYCATCHGLDATGNGPSAKALKTPPLDLTKIQEKGKAFPEIRVSNVVEGTGETSGSHGTRDMPIWGKVFRHTKGTPPMQQSVRTLVEYIESIQVNK